jgi:methionine synthase I (cobalamin-dependent)
LQPYPFMSDSSLRGNIFIQLLDTHPYLLADGATGTNLFHAGLQTGDAPELWNSDHADKILAHYRGFAAAGSDIILTNTFGGTAYRLKLHGAQTRVEELNVAAAELAHQVVEEFDRPIAIAGSIGPTGEILEPNGDLTKELASVAFREQALALKKGGVDVFWIETMSSVEEVEAAVDAVEDLGLPIVFTMSVDTNGRTMMGLTPSRIVELSSSVSARVHACGTNCGVGASEVVATIMTMDKAAKATGLDPVFVAKANCGIPQWVDGEIVYNGTPELMAEYVRLVLDAGARIVGGCCGTSYEHVAAMRKAMDDYNPGGEADFDAMQAQLGEVSAGAAALYRGEDTVAQAQSAIAGRRRRSRRSAT